MCFSKLPDVPLQRIFKHLPHRDMVCVGLTCKHWHKNAQASLRARHSLTIFIGTDPILYKPNSPDQINCFTLNRRMCDQLVSTFPNITELKIYLGKATSFLFENIFYLLECWSIGLTKFSFNYLGRMSLNNRNVLTLIDSINQLPDLKCLSLNHLFKLWLGNKITNLSILARLEEFSVEDYDPLGVYFDSLRQYGTPNDQLKQIKLRDDIYIHLSVTKPFISSQFSQLDPVLCNKMDYHPFNLTGPELVEHASRFASISTLNIYLNLAEIYISLSRLTFIVANFMPKLTSLEMWLNFRHIPSDHESLQLTPIPSVTFFKLNMNFTSHDNIAKHLQPKRIFPNLEEYAIVVLSASACLTCQNELTIGDGCNDITNLLPMPFRTCPKFTKGSISLSYMGAIQDFLNY